MKGENPAISESFSYLARTKMQAKRGFTRLYNKVNPVIEKSGTPSSKGLKRVTTYVIITAVPALKNKFSRTRQAGAKQEAIITRTNYDTRVTCQDLGAVLETVCRGFQASRSVQLFSQSGSLLRTFRCHGLVRY